MRLKGGKNRYLQCARFHFNKGGIWQGGIALSNPFLYSPLSSFLTEIVNGILVEKASVMIDHIDSRVVYWCEAVQHATGLKNRTATAEMSEKTPVKAFFELVAIISRPRSLGCASFVHKHEQNWRNKLESRTSNGIYMGNEHEPHRAYLHK